MAHIDHAFSIIDDDLMLDGSYSTSSNRAPIKEIALAVSLLVFGVVGIIADSFMVSNRVDGDRAIMHFLVMLGVVLFIPRNILHQDCLLCLQRLLLLNIPPV
ncbi:hypothetical protein LINPERHAP2_LOCUS13811 [Linum perenne]